MRILVTGATGFLGRHLTLALLERGEQVRALGRNPRACEELADRGAQVVRADLRDRAVVVGACAGMEAVCHAGALSAPWGKRADFFAVNVDGTANIIAGCVKHGVRRLVYISSPSVTFDGRDGVEMTEETPYPRRFTSVYSLTKSLGEQLVSRASQEGLPTVTLRPKAIFGPGDTSLLPRILTAARKGLLPQIGSGENWLDITYVDNVVHAICLALLSEKAVGRTYTITNGEAVRLWDLLKHILRQLGYPPPSRSIPFPLAYLAAAFMEAWSVVTGREPALTRYTVSILARTQTYDIAAARRDLEYCPVVTVAEGISRTLHALNQEGWANLASR